MRDTIILLPTYNERDNVARILDDLCTAYRDIRILVIDDSSPDGTAEEVRSIMKSNANIDLLLRPHKQGLGEAYKAGIQHVLADNTIKRIITMDADGSHAAEYVADLLSESGKYDLVIGSRYVRGGGIENWEPWRYMLSHWGNMYARAITGLPVRDLTAGLMCFRADVLRHVDVSSLQASGYAFLMELKFRTICTLKSSYIEIPIVFRARREGESKISQHIIREGLATPWKLRFRRK